MIEETGTVVAVESDGQANIKSTIQHYAWVETQVKTTCGSCKASDACPTSTIAKAFTPKAEHIRLAVPCKLVVGQQVKIGISENALLRASIMVYIIPLLLMIACAIILQILLPSIHELLALLASAVAALGGFWWASAYAKHQQHQHKFAPVFLGATNQAVMSYKHEIPTHKIE